MIFLIIEVSFRIFYTHNKTILPKDLYVRDGIRGHKMKPGFKGRHKEEEFDIEININSLGMRDNEVSGDSGDFFTIANIGDSFTFGYGLNREETISWRVGYKLSEAGIYKRKIRSLNLGTVGYGSVDSFIFLKAVWDRINPDLVIYYLYVGNDLLNDLNTIARIDNKIAEKHPVTPPLTDFLQRNSRFYDFLFKKLRNNHFLSKAFFRIGIRKLIEYLHRENDPFYNEGLKAITGNLTKMKTFTSEKNAELLIVLIPEEQQVFYKEIFKKRGLILRKPQNDLIAFCKDENIQHIDILPSLQRKNDPAVYFKYDSHFSPFGSDFITTEIAKYIINHKQLLQ